MAPPLDLTELDNDKVCTLEAQIQFLVAAAEESRAQFAEMTLALADMNNKLLEHDAKTAQHDARVEQLESKIVKQECIIDQLCARLAQTDQSFAILRDQLATDVKEQDKIIVELFTEQGQIITTVSRIAGEAAGLNYAVGRHEAISTRHTAKITEHGDIIERLGEATEELHEGLNQSAEQHQSHFDIINQICHLIGKIEHRIENIHSHIGIDSDTLDDDRKPLLDEEHIISILLSKLEHASSKPRGKRPTATATATAPAPASDVSE